MSINVHGVVWVNRRPRDRLGVCRSMMRYPYCWRCGQGCRFGSSTVSPSAVAAALRSRSAETKTNAPKRLADQSR